MTRSNQSEKPDDRLQREVDEILKHARSRPVSFQQMVEQKRNSLRRQRQSSKPKFRQITGRIVELVLKVPIITALGLAIIAAYLAPDFGVLATLFAVAAIAMVFIPFAVRRPASSLPDQTRWRGRVVSNLPPASEDTPRTWADHIKRRFNR